MPWNAVIDQQVGQSPCKVSVGQRVKALLETVEVVRLVPYNLRQSGRN
ncbi:hypothetical protein [Alicyclobacillus herbarius]|nr:hypothetical protein [Alicyclobacillus herbarius]